MIDGDRCIDGCDAKKKKVVVPAIGNCRERSKTGRCVCSAWCRVDGGDGTSTLLALGFARGGLNQSECRKNALARAEVRVFCLSRGARLAADTAIPANQKPRNRA